MLQSMFYHAGISIPMLSHGKFLFQTFSQIIGHMIEVKKIRNEVGAIFIFCHGTYKLEENFEKQFEYD